MSDFPDAESERNRIVPVRIPWLPRTEGIGNYQTPSTPCARANRSSAGTGSISLAATLCSMRMRTFRSARLPLHSRDPAAAAEWFSVPGPLGLSPPTCLSALLRSVPQRSPFTCKPLHRHGEWFLVVLGGVLIPVQDGTAVSPVEKYMVTRRGEPLGNESFTPYCTGGSTKRARRRAFLSASDSESSRLCTDVRIEHWQARRAAAGSHSLLTSFSSSRPRRTGAEFVERFRLRAQMLDLLPHGRGKPIHASERFDPLSELRR